MNIREYMMKIENKKNLVLQKKTPLLIAFVVLLGIGAISVYGLTNSGLFTDNPPAENNTSTSQTDDSLAPENSDNNLPEGAIDTGEGKPKEDGTTEPATQPSDGTSQTNLHASITAASQNGSNVQVRVLIQGVASGGTCSLTMKKDGVVVSRTSGIQALAHSSTCQGFDIATSELSAGEWSLSVVITASNSKIQLSKTISVT